VLQYVAVCAVWESCPSVVCHDVLVLRWALCCSVLQRVAVCSNVHFVRVSVSMPWCIGNCFWDTNKRCVPSRQFFFAVFIYMHPKSVQENECVYVHVCGRVSVGVLS